MGRCGWPLGKNRWKDDYSSSALHDCKLCTNCQRAISLNERRDFIRAEHDLKCTTCTLHKTHSSFDNYLHLSVAAQRKV